ncbi:phasin family protein [Wenxinia saemankumensis]|uniref:Phasin protein n=1 Tax=Wenxinia saemankumensis TaxID=1447782 RepID=A0A1M6CFD4_9RHOB|nr:phasin family protein [Wenxinia saemankumensis]SHI59696.1 Phasin protein [Wenxinia saemankumensis]
MAAKTQDYTAMMKDMMGAFPVDQKAMESMFKSQTAFAEKMSAVAIDAAQQSTDLSARWTQDTLTKMSAITQARTEPADYAKAMTDFATASAESAAEHMAAFADIAKKVQTETLELMMAMGKDMSTDMQDVARKATSDMTSAAKKASAK